VLGRKITLRYSGRCVHCGRTIPAGIEAYWEKGKGVWHTDCQSRILHRTDSNRSHVEPSISSVSKPPKRSLNAEQRNILLAPLILLAVVLFLLAIPRALRSWADIYSGTCGFIAVSCVLGLIILIPLTISAFISVITYWVTGKVYYVIPYRGTPSRPWRPILHRTRRYYQLQARSRKTSR
jgi:hypothetical protein